MDARRIRKKKITHRQCAQDALALLDHLGVKRGKAIGSSMGGNMKDSYDDMNFTLHVLARITASTLIVYGDRDFLDPIEMAVEMDRAILGSALWIVPMAATDLSSSTPSLSLFKPRLPFSEDRNKSRAGVDRSCRCAPRSVG